MITAKVFDKTDGDRFVLLIDEEGRVVQQYGPAQFARGEAELLGDVFKVTTTVMVPQQSVTEYEVIS